MKKIISKDFLQEGYSYDIVEKIGRNFHEEFKPDLTPKEMLELGVFSGNYFEGEIEEYPEDWFKSAKISSVDSPDLNFFEISASKPRSYWEDKGWIHPQDPRGWFQWYCRYYMGRRSEDDERQIKLWKAIFRHAGAIKKNCVPGDLACRRRQRQALLHWAVDSRKI